MSDKSIVFDRHQLAAIHGVSAMNKKITVITARAGRGKSTVLAEVLRTVWKSGKAAPINTYVGCPTGKASNVVSEMFKSENLDIVHEPATIHRILGYQGNDWIYNSANRLECDLFVIDEFSMCSSEMFARIIKSISKNAKIVLIFDPRQLFPVSAGCPGVDIYNASPPGVIYELVKNYRQAQGEALACVCEQIADGQLPVFNSPEYTNNNVAHHLIDDKEEIQQNVLGIVKPWFNEQADWVCLTPQNGGVIGVKELNDFLQEKLNPLGENEPYVKVFDTIYRVNDRVMHIKNNYKLEVFNGESGVITGINSGKIVVQYPDREIVYSEDKDKKQLTLGYVCSIHKSQGSQYSQVCLIFHSSHYFMLSRSLLYVGVSRAREELHIVGDAKGLRRGVTRTLRESRNTYLKLKMNNMTEL